MDLNGRPEARVEWTALGGGMRRWRRHAEVEVEVEVEVGVEVEMVMGIAVGR